MINPYIHCDFANFNLFLFRFPLLSDGSKTLFRKFNFYAVRGFMFLRISLAANFHLVFDAPNGLSYLTLSSSISLSSLFLPPTSFTATAQEKVMSSVLLMMDWYFWAMMAIPLTFSIFNPDFHFYLDPATSTV